MARGGFIDPKVFLQRAFDRNLTLNQAKKGAVEAMRVGRLSSRGRPAPAVSATARLKAGFKASAKIQSRPQQQDIPRGIWTGLSKHDVAQWDWESGRFFGNGDLDLEAWDAVKFNEAEANALLNLLAARHNPAQAEAAISPVNERRRGAAWDEWVAVIATLAYEQVINETSTDADILQLAALRLGIDDPSTRRMKSAAMAIVGRWKRTPPRTPGPTQLKFVDPTPKR